MGCASSSPDVVVGHIDAVKTLTQQPQQQQQELKAPVSLELKLYYERALAKKQSAGINMQTYVAPAAAAVKTPAAPAAAAPQAITIVLPAAKELKKKEAPPRPAKPPKMTRLELYYTEAWKKLQQPHTCNICMEENIQLEMMCARGSREKLTVQQARDGCGHFACKECMQSYIANCIESRKYPILCTDSASGCGRLVMYGDVIQLLTTSDQPKNLQALQQLEVEAAIPAQDRLYCPYKDCSTLLMRSKSHRACEVSTCPQCSRDFCPSCLFQGCHRGYTCAEIPMLLAGQQNTRALEDHTNLMKLAKAQDWKPCPRCKVLVDRIDGCNYVRCICGCGFCYKCGKEYLTKTATTLNTHGQAACTCGLFSYVFADD